MMKADIKIVRLIRRAVAEKKSSMDENGCYFATDYFDDVQIESKEMEDPFLDIMDIGREERCCDKTAEQSYALYCSVQMLEGYETGRSEVQYRGDPFQEKGGLEYLSIIHVYILPEIMARMDYDTASLWKDCDIILKPFVDDIYQTLDGFKKDHAEEEFVARVYLMLSAGDFAVVIRSRKPETSYYIATYLRKREAGRTGSDCSSGFVLYKTYTLLSLKKQVIPEAETADKTENYFVIRGCFSNKYWKEQDKIFRNVGDDIQKKIERFYPINGRYDFTAQLTEAEFFELMPDILGKKQKSITADEAFADGKQLTVVGYLSFLLQNGYLSYINERYMMAEQRIGKGNQSVSPFIVIDEKEIHGSELIDRNGEKIEQVLKLQEKLVEKVSNMKGYRKQIRQYLFLLKKQILVCDSVNEVSDTRIYAGILLEQLEVALYSIDAYMKLYEKESGNEELLNLMEDYLVKAVRVLDCYAQYIRNNNLQSLQTPNYNIQTSMGMEKVLIGYSELLWKFMEYYSKTIESAGKDYLPVMIPDFAEVNVEVLFPEDVDSSNEGLADTDSSNESINRRLLVVEASTLEELADLPVMITALFHETAHQFRYESREERNDALLKSAIREVINQVAEKVSDLVIGEIGSVVDDGGSLSNGLTDGMTEALLECGYRKGDTYAYDFQEAPLERFERELASDINAFFSEYTFESGIEQRIEEFITEIKDGIPVLGDIFGDLDGLEKIVRSDSLQGIEEWAYSIAWHYAYKCLDENNKSNVKINCDDCRKLSYRDKWDESFKEVNDMNVCRIFEAFEQFYHWIRWQREVMPGKKAQKFALDTFEANLYSFMRKYWQDTMKQSVNLHDAYDMKESEKKTGSVPSYHYWSMVGRYLGLDDTAENGSRFKETIKKEIRNATERCGCCNNTLIRNYREETADLLMCKVMSLSPLGYLNLAAYQFIQDDHHNEPEIERVFRVLLVAYCPADQCERGERFWDNQLSEYGKLLCAIFNEMKISLIKMLADTKYMDADRLKQFEKEYPELHWKNQGGLSDINTMLDSVNSVAGSLQAWKSSFAETCAVPALEAVNNFLRVYDILAILIRDGRHLWADMKEDAELYEDLVRGNNRLKDLHHKMLESEDLSVCELGDTCRVISGFMAKSHSQNGIVRDGKLNQKCIELLIRMYYNNKIRKAQEHRAGR